MSATLDLTQDLMARRSVTPADEGCQEVMMRRLRALGFEVEPLRFGSVENFWARHGRDDGPVFCFAGHTDVVPTGPLEEWRSDPFQPTVRDGLLYGRGAADMKSGLAAMITATEEFVAAHPAHRGRIAFLITSDEEGPSVDGTKRVVETLAARSERIDWCLVGEPSSEAAIGDTIKIGRRGSFSGRLTVHGVQGHVAYPHLAENPVHTLAPALAELTSRSGTRARSTSSRRAFRSRTSTRARAHPTSSPGSSRRGSICATRRCRRLEGLKETVEGILRKHGVRYTLEWYVSGEPFYTPPGKLSEAVRAAIAGVTGRRPKMSTGGGTSDGRFIAPLGAQVVELGVVNAIIHKVNECVRLDGHRRAAPHVLQRAEEPSDLGGARHQRAPGVRR